MRQVLGGRDRGLGSHGSKGSGRLPRLAPQSLLGRPPERADQCARTHIPTAMLLWVSPFPSENWEAQFWWEMTAFLGVLFEYSYRALRLQRLPYPSHVILTKTTVEARGSHPAHRQRKKPMPTAVTVGAATVLPGLPNPSRCVLRSSGLWRGSGWPYTKPGGSVRPCNHSSQVRHTH